MVYKGEAGTQEMRVRGKDMLEFSIKQALALEIHTCGRKQIMAQTLKYRNGVWRAGEMLGLNRLAFRSFIQPFTC